MNDGIIKKGEKSASFNKIKEKYLCVKYNLRTFDIVTESLS